MGLKILKGIGFFVIAFSLSSWALANSYSRGNWKCSDFEELKNLHEYKPENSFMKIGYAICLIVKGEDELGKGLLDSMDNNAAAAYYKAFYIQSDGDLANTHYHKLDEAISAYLHTLNIIRGKPSYPDIDEHIYERNYQIELRSVYRVPYLYFLKYELGRFSAHHIKLYESSSISAEESTLEFWKKHSSSMQKSLEKTLLYAEQCLNLPKKRHFQDNRYFATRDICGILKEFALKAQSLEERRLTALSNCDNLTKEESSCPVYYDYANELNQLYIQANNEINEILKSPKLKASY